MDDVRLIDANALQRAFDKAHEGKPDFFCDNFLNNAGNPSTEWDCVDDILQSAPTVDAVPVKLGKWIAVTSYDAFGGDPVQWEVHGNPIAYHYCSECKNQCDVDENGDEILSDFCPDCGADMRGVE